MQLGAVCDRTIDGEVVSFGTTGYTMNNVFVLYDRSTDSVWYPLSDDSFDAVSGPNKGKRLDFIAKPEVMRLHEWAEMHPDTLVLLPTKHDEDRDARRKAFIAKFVGSWDMLTDFQGQQIDAVMTIVFVEGQGFEGVWSSMGSEMEMTEIRYDGEILRFKREMPGGPVLEFNGEIDGTSIEGTWVSEMGELECQGTKLEVETPASRPEN